MVCLSKTLSVYGDVVKRKMEPSKTLHNIIYNVEMVILFFLNKEINERVIIKKNHSWK